jgi:energy-coupling factor transport system ATP-binding protein
MSAGTGPSGVVVDGFGFRYTGRTEWALHDVEFRIEPGERILLTGASGSGKSTLLAAMAGLLSPDAGDARGAVRVDGRTAVQARDRIGILFQDPDSQLVMGQAGDDVAFGLENRGVPPAEIWPRVRAALDAVRFGYPLDRSTQALSGGEKQRLVLAGALVAEPGLLLLDEPTSQLDQEGAALVREAVARILARRRTTLVLIDHDAGPWLSLVDRVLEVQSGTSQIGSRAGVGELAPGWRPGVPALPPRTSAQHGPPSRREAQQAASSLSEGRLLPIGSTQGVLDSTAERTLLRAERVGFTYPGRAVGGSALAPTRPALPPTDVELSAGGVTAITGKNGSGKSTLGLLLAGLKAPTVGQITVSPQLAGTLGDRPPHRWRARDLVHRIGTVFQNPEQQFLTGRVRDELSLGPLRAGAGNRAAHDRAEELLVRLGLTAYADANPFTLSGGQQRRLSVATALATRPSVLILDEPTFGQDPATWEELVRLLAEARDAGTALCLISHDTRLVDGFADHELRLGEPQSSDETPVDHRKGPGLSAATDPKTPRCSDDQLRWGPGR